MFKYSPVRRDGTMGASPTLIIFSFELAFNNLSKQKVTPIQMEVARNTRRTALQLAKAKRGRPDHNHP